MDEGGDTFERRANDASRLTDRSVRALKPRLKQFEVRDTEVRGLALRVNRTSKSWIMVGKFGGRQTTRCKIGEYPVMSLAQARAEALRWRAAIAQGRPIATQKRP